jgi:predicted nucleic acid-binding protein
VLVVLDACVLYPPSLRDLLLTLAALDAFEVRWSEEILEELRRNVVADNPDVDPDRFSSHTLGAMRAAFPDGSVTGYEPLIESLDNDPKDRHVAAVALAAGAAAVVTIDVAGFRGNVLAASGMRVLTPGALVSELLDSEPAIVVAAVEELAARWERPSRSITEILDLLPDTRRCLSRSAGCGASWREHTGAAIRARSETASAEPVGRALLRERAGVGLPPCLRCPRGKLDEP